MITKKDFELEVLSVLRDQRIRGHRLVTFNPRYISYLDQKQEYYVAGVQQGAGQIELFPGSIKLDHTSFGDMTSNAILSQFSFKTYLSEL